MESIIGITDKEKDKIKTLFDNVGIYTSGENKVHVELKGIGNFYILPEEHQMSPSYLSGLPYAYQFFKSKGKELDFQDLINFKIPDQDFYVDIPKLAQQGLTKILQNEKLKFVYQGLTGNTNFYGDSEDYFLYECSKYFGTKSENELEKIKDRLESSFIYGGFNKTFNSMFGEDYLSGEPSKQKFKDELFKAIREEEFRTSVIQKEFNTVGGFRGNEYIRLLQKLKKYK